MNIRPSVCALFVITIAVVAMPVHIDQARNSPTLVGNRAEALGGLIGSVVGCNVAGPVVAGCALSDVSSSCSSGGACTDRDRIILDRLATQCDYLSGGVTCSEAQQQEAAQAQNLVKSNKNATAPTDCSGVTGFFYQPTVCIGRSLSAIIGSALITLTAWLLQIVGQLFNWLLYYTVIAFGDSTNGFLTPGVLKGINITWTMFRDVANILIIGLFTFTAISIILGLKEYGQKRMIAKALIIAVLINFSLLFTKMIVDASNFTAYQFYNAASNLHSNAPNSQAGGAASVVDTVVTFQQDGIAGQFIKYLGVTSINNTFGVLKDGADNVNNGWITLLHGVFSATLLGATAAVFIYGCFLLTARAILIVFLLITSSLAFASYLLPSSMQGPYGWSLWWKSLLKTSVFAPLLLMFLWATITLANALKPTGGSLGDLLNDPGNAGNLSALFSYIIILGLLFASFKISSSFATTISGFNFAGLLLPRLGVGAFAVGSRLAAPVGRQLFGRGAASESKALERQIAAEAAAAARARSSGQLHDLSKLTSLMKQKDKADVRAKRDYNLMNTGGAKELTKALGLSGVLAGEKKVGGYAGPRKEAAEEAAKKAVGVALSQEQSLTAARQEKQEDRQYQMQRQAIEAEISAARTNQQAVQEMTKTNEGQITKLREEMTKATDTLAKETAGGAEIEERLKSGKITQAQRDAEFREQEERIKGAHQTVTGLQSQIHAIERPQQSAAQRLQDAERKLKEFDRDTESAVRNRASAIQEAGVAVAQDIAGTLAHGDAYVAEEARSAVKKQVGFRRIKDRITAEKQLAKDAGEEEKDT